MKKLKNVILILAFLTGLSIFMYPTVSNWLARHNQIQAVQKYNQYVTNLTAEQMAQEWKKAREYNQQHRSVPVVDPFAIEVPEEPDTEYFHILDIDGIMGYLEIPKIEVKLPIYHGVSEEVLKKGVGHIQSTGLPIGGEGNHAVLSAHSGLREARLFTDLEKLKEDDYFYLYVLDEKLAYKVDQISIVEPEDISSLKPEEDKDYITLVTCTPIGINSHRLLVRGERCDVPDEVEEVGVIPKSETWRLLIIVIVLLVLVIMVWNKKRLNKKKSKGQETT